MVFDFSYYQSVFKCLENICRMSHHMFQLVRIISDFSNERKQQNVVVCQGGMVCQGPIKDCIDFSIGRKR